MVMISMFPGIKEVLENLKQEGLRLGVVSTKRSDVLKRGVSILGITEYFDTIIGSGDFSHPGRNALPGYGPSGSRKGNERNGRITPMMLLQAIMPA